MPIYTFHCLRCNEEFQSLVSSSAGEAPACPACGASGAERLPAAPAIGGRGKAALSSARAQAAKEGHFSNYSKSELKGKF
ncbi:FmdB family zinc ribbon protein [Pararhodospirillum oryzae]|uniref:FmdB family transcriptional regulator n=1 Tax=Pararhodospirillum oryzae TaxID=478448 RepID=A0A512H9C0_9PROT|nr:zinc ribbon domain-containing protein [Pararhodospirillum oryzae]GEO82057.1 FmdB family transcriptional regulator [Pararhodospirillum oryzae]